MFVCMSSKIITSVASKNKLITQNQTTLTIVITRMPNGAKSLAIGNVIPTTAPLLAAYATCPTCPSYAATLAVFIMHPLNPSLSTERRAIRSAAKRERLNVPATFTSSAF
jgi:hypothetical protein